MVDVYQIVTDKIIAQLEQGVNPWRKPWMASTGQHMNLVSRKPYRGINAVITMMSGYTSPYWVTFRQAKELGGTVRKGEKGTAVVFWTLLKRTEKDKTTGEKTERQIPFIRYYTIFNAEQCDGLTVPTVERSTVPADEAAEAAIAAWGDKPVIQHYGDRAVYIPLADRIEVPVRQAFHSTGDYYGTLFHELVHATGAAHRLDRFKPNEGQFTFGSESYSQEELTAEIGSSFLAARIGLVLDEHNQAAYLRAWLKRLKNDKKFIFVAARQAQQAADCILGVVATNGDAEPVVNDMEAA